jgi:hypothetical protein
MVDLGGVGAVMACHPAGAAVRDDALAAGVSSAVAAAELPRYQLVGGEDAARPRSNWNRCTSWIVSADPGYPRQGPR